MGDSHDDQAIEEYDFKTLGASGRITLKKDSVIAACRSYNGSWEQEVPLRSIQPRYGTLRTTPMILVWARMFAIITICICGLSFLGFQKLNLQSILFLAATILTCGVIYWRLSVLPPAEWIWFYTNDGGRGISFTRQGKDHPKCDAFVKRLQQAIESAQETDSAEG